MTGKEAISIIKIIAEDYTPRATFKEVNEALDLAIKTLEERPQGEWIEDSGNIACSYCHAIWLYRRTDFCPNCGAKMKGGKE